MVTSLAEVWIETITTALWQPFHKCHFPCGSVDWNHCFRLKHFAVYASLPLRKCGLKHLQNMHSNMNPYVTSLAEVWIETMSLYSIGIFLGSSLPLRKCGLKLYDNFTVTVNERHFPCGSVDWNEQYINIFTICEKSLPLRKCGLKHGIPWQCRESSGSLPLRKCGLKPG